MWTEKREKTGDDSRDERTSDGSVRGRTSIPAGDRKSRGRGASTTGAKTSSGATARLGLDGPPTRLPRRRKKIRQPIQAHGAGRLSHSSNGRRTRAGVDRPAASTPEGNEYRRGNRHEPRGDRDVHLFEQGRQIGGDVLESAELAGLEEALEARPPGGLVGRRRRPQDGVIGSDRWSEADGGFPRALWRNRLRRAIAEYTGCEADGADQEEGEASRDHRA
jgi:hypothetical protein